MERRSYQKHSKRHNEQTDPLGLFTVLDSEWRLCYWKCWRISRQREFALLSLSVESNENQRKDHIRFRRWNSHNASRSCAFLFAPSTRSRVASKQGPQLICDAVCKRIAKRSSRWMRNVKMDGSKYQQGISLCFTVQVWPLIFSSLHFL